MKRDFPRRFLPVIVGLYPLAASTPVFAYLGPGAGLGMIGTLVAVLVVVLVVLLGLVVYPVRMMRKKVREAASARKAELTE